MTTIIITVGIISLVSLITLALLCLNAPYGYEDETGFHWGNPE